ncbi:hypothetical protein L345_17767, partial [Ophiophagus hannah]
MKERKEKREGEWKEINEGREGEMKEGSRGEPPVLQRKGGWEIEKMGPLLITRESRLGSPF